MFKRTTLV